MKQEIIMIAALAKNFVIGSNGQIPWHIREEFEHFKNTTENNITIMGRNTWFSLPEQFRPLPNRINIVLSEDKIEGDCITCTSLDSVFEECEKYMNKKIFICGGAGVYSQTITLADKMILSWVKGDFEGDTYFPKFNESEWKITSQEDREKFTIKYYEKN